MSSSIGRENGAMMDCFKSIQFLVSLIGGIIYVDMGMCYGNDRTTKQGVINNEMGRGS